MGKCVNFNTGWYKPFSRNPSPRLWCVYVSWRFFRYLLKAYVTQNSCPFIDDPQALLPPSQSLTEEIFMASQLNVYVSLAHTLAPAGKVHARNAGCSNADDEAHRRREPKPCLQSNTERVIL